MVMDKDKINARMQLFVKTLRGKHLKLTHQRMEVFRFLAASEKHPDAETVYRRVHKRIPAVSRDTVYRTLALLEEQGLVQKAEVTHGPARYDANMEHHHHFVCTNCGLVRDVHSDEMEELKVPSTVENIGNVSSFEIKLRGLCKKCSKKKTKP